MMISSVARFRFIKTKVFLGTITELSQTKFHHITVTKSNYSSLNSSTKMGKNEKVGKNFWITKRGKKGITNRDRFWGLRTGARGITNRDSFRDSKSGEKYYKLGQRLQIGAREISNRVRDFRSGQGLQIRAGITVQNIGTSTQLLSQ